MSVMESPLHMTTELGLVNVFVLCYEQILFPMILGWLYTNLTWFSLFSKS